MLTTVNNFTTENTFSIESEKDLVSSFRLRDQKKLVLPAGLKFPLHIRSYFTWSEPTGSMCGWCHSYGSPDEVGMMSVSFNSNTSAAYILCQNLRCIEKIEEAANLSGKSVERVVDQLYSRINLFFEGVFNYEQE